MIPFYENISNDQRHIDVRHFFVVIAANWFICLILDLRILTQNGCTNKPLRVFSSSLSHTA